jgi:hypothetical protein
MPLKAQKPETIEKRLKLFLFGNPKVGKTTAELNFPAVYLIDTEKGAVHEQYVKLMQANGSQVFHTNDVDEVIDEIRALGTERHGFKTVAIDPVTMLEADLVEKAEKEFGAGDMRIWGKRDRKMKRLLNLLNKLDMNVIVTAHGKIDYGPNMVRLGTTFDAWKRWPYAFDLIIELEKRGEERVAIVKGSRIETFKEGETFNWSYEEFKRRYPIIEKDVEPVTLATTEQVHELKSLLEVVKLPEGTVDKWLTKASVDCIEDMDSSSIEKCIKYVRDKIQGEKK